MSMLKHEEGRLKHLQGGLIDLDGYHIDEPPWADTAPLALGS